MSYVNWLKNILSDQEKGENKYRPGSSHIPVCGGMKDGVICPKAAECYRFSAFINKEKDYFLSEAPFITDTNSDKPEEVCHYYIPLIHNNQLENQTSSNE